MQVLISRIAPTEPTTVAKTSTQPDLTQRMSIPGLLNICNTMQYSAL